MTLPTPGPIQTGGFQTGSQLFLPRLVIAAPQGRSGKTTITLGICAALRAQGLKIQPFKKGPDYIDPSWLSEAAGQVCRSLDPFFLGNAQQMKLAFARGATQADLNLIEGNHGLYDGSSLEQSSDWSASSAEVARILECPVILVVNTARMSRSVAAMVLGYQTFEPHTNIVGVILNNVAQGRHESKLRQAIEQYCSIPVLGAIPRDAILTIPDRHLGLIPQSEHASTNSSPLPAIQACQQMAEKHIDLDLVLEIARSASPMNLPQPEISPEAGQYSGPVQVGVIRDRAFTFYYPENLEELEKAGAKLHFIDAFQDTRLPNLDALVIGGGFPEIFIQELAANLSLLRSLHQAIENDLPVYAECGGLMYLCKRIRWGEQNAEMVGVLPYDVEMSPHPVGHGYVLAEVIQPNPFFPIGAWLRGHEFHHSRLVVSENQKNKMKLSTHAYQLKRGKGLGNARDGLVYRNVLAGYTHLHADGAPGWANAIIRCARAYCQQKEAMHG